MMDNGESKALKQIRKTVALLKQGPFIEATEAFSQLALIDQDELLPELFVEIEDAFEGIDPEEIVATDLLPDPILTNTVVQAVINDNVEKLKIAVNDAMGKATAGEDVRKSNISVPAGYPELIVTLVATIVALELSKK